MAIFRRLSKHEPANTIALGRQIAEERVSAGRVQILKVTLKITLKETLKVTLKENVKGTVKVTVKVTFKVKGNCEGNQEASGIESRDCNHLRLCYSK
jgi:hypothetical protein